MAQKLGFFSQWMWGNWAERDVINKNADALESVDAKVTALQSTIARQTQEIIQLRAMVTGLANVLQTKVALDDSELEAAVTAAWQQLNPPPPAPPVPSDPYRGMPGEVEPTPEEIEAAKKLFREAQDHHFAKRFDEASAIYKDIVDRYGATKQAASARQQLANLRR